MTTSIESKLEVIKKGLELGARIELRFVALEESEAIKVIEEISQLLDEDIESGQTGKAKWLSVGHSWDEISATAYIDKTKRG